MRIGSCLIAIPHRVRVKTSRHRRIGPNVSVLPTTQLATVRPELRRLCGDSLFYR